MKTSNALFQTLKAGFVPVMFALGMPVTAAPVAPAPDSKQGPPLSVFTMPANPQQGRDPFFPDSMRPYQDVVRVSAHPNVVDLSSLVSLQGMSGTSNERLVIINKHTLAVGDDAEVSTSQGRIRVHCLEINTNSAVIEANGQRITLRYEEKP